MDKKPEETPAAQAAPQEETTAEFATEDVKKEAEVLESSQDDLSDIEFPSQKSVLGSWIPVVIGLVTLVGMVLYALKFWLPR